MSAQEARQVIDIREAPEELDRLAARLKPGVNRAEILGRLDQIFRTGSAPDPTPDGFLPGKLLATSAWGPLDGFFRRVAAAYMPWQGKIFERESMTGVNRFLPNVRIPLKVVFPSYTAERETFDRIEAFPFRNRVEPGALDAEVQVLKIDYDFEANPGFLIRSVLDELVQVAPGRYLGKILFRVRSRWHPIGFFSLSEP